MVGDYPMPFVFARRSNDEQEAENGSSPVHPVGDDPYGKEWGSK